MLADRILAAVSHDTASTLLCDHSRCLRMRYAESRCAQCAHICPAQAIDVSDGLALHRERCTGCLSCSTVCPSGALETAVDTDRLLQSLAGHRQETFVLGCERNQGQRANYRLPCLGMLSLEHLLALAATTPALLQLDGSGCTGCNANGMLPVLSAQLDRAMALQPPSHPIRLIALPEQLDYRSEQFDRRDFFRSFRRMALEGAQAVLAPVEPASGDHSYADKVLPRRRSLLLTIKHRLTTAAAAALTHRRSFSEACTGCLGCVRACPTGALRTVEASPDSPPAFEPARCTGCGLCVEFCLDEAITPGN